ncbi:hypothetical protein NBO_27g0045 [Nosema bombycis CQ1]|uniref:Uncharacterized protein n=1 Tax=Nosema bombycis (strain CQ1 / CVCC 102059) TaxID=578461 RepID=R0MNQ2_NOSB1|nr:hypothetical protein NBO_27g0045 [Nosema bombycis CQ1]|eukprot:EOB14488.1 hypothetical protein NBO_27g0045 [Nosema bombycis CQ1]
MSKQEQGDFNKTNNLTCFNLKNNVDTIISLGDHVYLGSYDLLDNEKSGTIHKIKYSAFFERGNNLVYQKSVRTTGTFDLNNFGTLIVAANSKDLTLFDEDLNEIKKIRTKTFNTKISIKDNLIVVSNGLGNINIYDKELDLIKNLKLSEDILWIVEAHDKFVYCGGEDCNLYVLNIDDLSIKYQIKFNEGITSLCFENDHFLVGSYDQNIYKINYNGQIFNKKYIGGGVWRIEKMGADYVVSCMYEGCKILDNQLDVIKTYQSEPLIYSLAVINGKIFFNSFYERVLYVV